MNGFRLTVLCIIWFTCYKIFTSLLIRLLNNTCELFKVLIITGLLFNTLSLFLYFLGLRIILVDILSYNGLDVMGVTVDRGIPRLIGVTFDPNFYVLFAAPFIFLFLDMPKGRYRTILLWLSLVNILLSFSRSGCLAIVLTVAFRFFWKNKYPDGVQKRSRYTRYNLVMNMVFISVLLFWKGDLLLSIFKQRLVGILGGSGRAELYDTMIALWSSSPFFGVGFHNFRHYNLIETGKFFYGHNTFLEILVEGGIFGFALYFLFLFSFIVFNYNLVGSDERYKFLVLSIISILTSSLFLTALVNESLLLLLIVSSTAMALKNLEK